MSWLRVPSLGESPKKLYAMAAAGTLGPRIMLLAMQGAADDFDDATEPQRQHAPLGTRSPGASSRSGRSWMSR